jgi:hypothetical protein
MTMAICATPRDLPDGQINGPIDLPVQPLSEKYFASRFGRNSFIDSAVHSTQGAYRDRHGRGVGCDGRGWRD